MAKKIEAGRSLESIIDSMLVDGDRQPDEFTVQEAIEAYRKRTGKIMSVSGMRNRLYLMAQKKEVESRPGMVGGTRMTLYRVKTP